jgi:hypothetical protein
MGAGVPTLAYLGTLFAYSLALSSKTGASVKMSATLSLRRGGRTLSYGTLPPNCY